MEKLHRFAQKTVSRFSWRQNMKRLTGEDPFSCPRCGYEMVVFQITYPEDGKLKTVGGFDWLLRRGILKDFKTCAQEMVEHKGLQLSLFDRPPKPAVEQLSVCFA